MVILFPLPMWISGENRAKLIWQALWVADPRNFHNSFLVKNYQLSLNFFQVLWSALLKNEKNILKKIKNHLKIVWRSKRQKKIIENKKRQMRKTQTTAINIFLLFLPYIRKNYILLDIMFIWLHLYYSFFTWQVIGITVIKHERWYRYALVL